MFVFSGHTASVLSVVYAPDGRRLASGGADHTVRLLDLATGQSRLAVRDAGGPVLSLAFSPDGRLLAVGTSSRVVLHDQAGDSAALVLRGQYGGTYSVAFGPDSRRVILTGYRDPHLSLYDLHDVSHYHPLQGSAFGVLCVALSRQGDWVVSGGGFPGRGELWLHNLQRLTEPGQTLSSLVPNQSLVLYRGDALIQAAHAQAIYSVAITPDNRLIASGGRDQLVKLWGRESGTLLATLSRHRATVVALSFPPSGTSLLSADEDGLVCLWELSTGRWRHSWDWRVGRLRSVVFSPNGETAAAGGDRDVIVWDIDEID